MSTRILPILLVSAAALGVFSWGYYQYPDWFSHDAEGAGASDNPAGLGSLLERVKPKADVAQGPPLYTSSTPLRKPGLERRSIASGEPIVIGDCRLVVFEKEDVPSQRDGVILFIGTEVADNETVPPDLLIQIQTEQGTKRYRRLREGDMVKSGQLLAKLDDRLARAELALKLARVEAAKAESQAAEKARDEAKARVDTGKKLQAKRAMAPEEMSERQLVWDTKFYEAIGKKRAIDVAEQEVKQAQTLLAMHEIRSSIDGIIKTIYKNPGEAVKSAPSYEGVFQVLNLNRLRVEGLVDEQVLPFLHRGEEVVIEAVPLQAPEAKLVGHMQEVTGVAVARDGKLIVSGSLDGTVRIWDKALRSEQRILRLPGPVSAVACTPRGASANLCLSGSSDGSVRVWDLGLASKTPLQTLQQAHHGAVNCLTFSPDGTTFATGGDDREIALWDTATGKLRYRLLGHGGAVTALTFTPNAQLVSAARDNTVRMWDLGQESGHEKTLFTRRSGDVAQPGVSSDGRWLLFDPWQSQSLRLLALPEGSTEAVLDGPLGGHRFAQFGLFAPAGDAFVTAGSADGRLLLWQPPTPLARPHIRRYLVPPPRSIPTCAAFAPDSSYLAVGTRDRYVLVWPRSCPEENQGTLRARISHIERALDSNQARIWAEMNNPDGRLLPGATVTLVRYPK